MSYVDSQLLPGETVRYRARLHKITFFWGYAFAVLALGAAIAGFTQSTMHTWRIVALACLAISAILYLRSAIRSNASEFAVTNKRVVIKVGSLQRRTLETMLSKVEGVGVDQSVMGRILNFGTITVTGTGGTKEEFERIAAPLEFRRQVQAAISAVEDARMGAAPATHQGADP